MKMKLLCTIICIYQLLQNTDSNIVVFENVFPYNELDHVVAPSDGSAVVSTDDIQKCLDMALFFKGISYYNQDDTDENINGLSIGINGRISCVFSHDRWPQSRSSELFKTSAQIGLSTSLGGYIFNVGFYNNFSLSTDESLQNGLVKLEEDNLSFNRIAQSVVPLDVVENTNVLACMDLCNDDVECHHIEIYKGNIEDDINVRCRLYSRESLHYEVTTHQKYIHFRRKNDFNLLMTEKKDEYIKDTRTIVLIFLVVVFSIFGSLGLWEFCELKYFSHRFDTV